MPLDPQVKELLDNMAVQNLPPLSEQSPAEARRSMRLKAADMGVNA